ncbi:glycosyltransferase family 4 protein [Sphingomonas crocodyli]|uniref:Glycosyltransferase family 1 protein n=1 Tax=Sphingomonas crocodyli TaxID=1979270 RepID=A0A437MBD7_9SPHN|nr:glycosyltransferase family 1 protein [Sphingomonas crocodyli]RVT94948.1 glycosyltransferase family 1 protein [Sphingomonas crocodyli]
MRIVFDPQGALGGSRFRGIGRYTRSFLREFARQGQHHEIFILLNTMLPASFDMLRADLEGLVPEKNFIFWSAEAPIGGMHPENWERRHFAREIWEAVIDSLEPDLLVVSSLFEGAEDDAVSSVPAGRTYLVATICYDLIPLIYSQYYLPDQNMRVYYRQQLEALRRSDFLLAISQSAADEAVQLLRYPIDRVVNIGAAVDVAFGAAPPIDLRERFGISRPYMLYVSAFEIRKNHAGLIHAYAALSPEVRAAHQLVLGGGVGAIEHLRGIATEAGLAEDEIVFTGLVDDGELAALYAQSKAVAFPSWHEGFGLPILEAMMFGKAVISSNRSSMPEVVGLDEALFDPFDVDEMRDLVERVLTDDFFRERLEQNAPHRVAAFTWERSARLALEFLEGRMAAPMRPRDHNRRFVANALDRVNSNHNLADFPRDIASRHIAKTFRRDDRRQLLIDVSRLVIVDAKTGIQRVVRAILSQLIKNPPLGWIVEPVHANANELGYRYARKFADSFLGIRDPWHEDHPVEAWSGDILCVLDLEPDTLIKQRPVLDEWRLRGVKVHTVVYDILPLLLPEYFPDSVGDRVIGRWVRELVRHDGACCISETVSQQLADWIDANNVETNPGFRLNWFHLGSDLVSTHPTKGMPDDAMTVLAEMALRPTALMVGTLEPRKGHHQAIKAFELLWQRGIDIALVIVGHQGWRIDELAQHIRSHPECGKRLIWLEGISDQYLERLYGAATFLLAASEGEGFGLPLIEAGRKGLPLVVRDLPVFHEAVGDAAFYFPNNRDESAMAESITKWLELHSVGGHPKAHDVRPLDWSESAQMLFQALTNTKERSQHAG